MMVLKKVLALLLAAAMIACMGATAVFAEDGAASGVGNSDLQPPPVEEQPGEPPATLENQGSVKAAVGISSVYACYGDSDEQMTVDNPRNTLMDSTDAYPLIRMNNASFFAVDENGDKLTTEIDWGAITVIPENAVRVDGGGIPGVFKLRPGKGGVATVTVGGVSFKVSSPEAIVTNDGAWWVPTLDRLSEDGKFTSGRDYNGKAYDDEANPYRTETIGIAFIDASERDGNRLYNQPATFKHSAGVGGIKEVAYRVAADTGITSDDTITGIDQKDGLDSATYRSPHKFPNRDVRFFAEITLNDDTTVTSMPFCIRWGNKAGASDQWIWASPEGDTEVYIDELNRLIAEHSITYNDVADGGNPNTILFRDGTKVVPNPNGDTTKVITIPDGKVIKLYGYGANSNSDKPDSKAEIRGGRIEIGGEGSNKLLLSNLAMYAGEAGQTAAISGGRAVLSKVDIDGYFIGLDVSEYVKPLKNGVIRNCGTGIQISTDLNILGFQGNRIQKCGVGIALTDDASQGHQLINIHRNMFIDNAKDITYDKEIGTPERMYLTQNFFGTDTGSSYAQATPKVTGNIQVSPYYKGSDFKVLTADIAEATDTDGMVNLPVDTTVDGGYELSNDVFDAIKPVGRTAAVPALNIPLRDGSDMSVPPLATWSFAVDKLNPAFVPNGDIAMNTMIDKNIADFSGNVGTHEKVSFKHSGLLPGVATVEIKSEAVFDPAKPLLLYKIVGGYPVLQVGETPTMADGKLTFLRGDCSDYLITDTEITATGGNNSDSGSSGGSDDYTSSEDISDKLDSTGAGGNAVISVAGKPNVGVSAFDVLKKNPGKSLTLKGEGYSWTFKGSDLVNSIPGLIYINTSISSASPNAAAVQKAAGDAAIQNVYFGYHGQLPGRAVIELAVDKKFAGKALNLYYFNAATGKLSLVQSGLKQKDGKVSFAITHCSDYLLTPDAIPGAGAVTAKINNPDTGAKDVVPMAAAIATLSLLGATLLLRRKEN